MRTRIIGIAALLLAGQAHADGHLLNPNLATTASELEAAPQLDAGLAASIIDRTTVPVSHRIR